MFYLYSLTFILAICRCIHEDSRSSAAQSLTPHYLFCKGKAPQLDHCRSNIIWGIMTIASQYVQFWYKYIRHILVKLLSQEYKFLTTWLLLVVSFKSAVTLKCLKFQHFIYKGIYILHLLAFTNKFVLRETKQLSNTMPWSHQ